MAMGWMSLSGVAFGLVFVPRKRSAKIWKRGLWISSLGVLAVCLFTLGCGGNSSSPSHQQAANTVTVMVTGTSGSISHSSAVTLTVQ